MMIALISLLSFLCLARCDTDCFYDTHHWIKRTGSDTCIAVYTTKKTREMARQDCDAHGAILVKPQIQADNIYLNERAGNTDVWISLNDINQEGNFVWQDDTAPTNLLWADNEPYGNGDCVTVSEQWQKKWNDKNCSAIDAYACQKLPRCRDGWTYFADDHVCIAVYTTEKTREMARQDCDVRNAVLVKPQSQAVNNWLNEKAGHKDVWISLNDINQEGTFVWEDGSAPTTTLWSPLEPYGNGDCVTVSERWDKKWNDVNCTISEAYACQKPPMCPDDWTYFPGTDSCIRVYTTAKTRAMAKQECAALNAELVKPQTQEVNNYLNEQAGHIDVWISLNDIDAEGTFVWDDGTAPTNLLWATNEPYGNGDCVTVSQQWQKKWNDKDCSLSEAYACEKPAVV